MRYNLQAASLGGHDTVVQVLLGKGADVNAVGGQYDTALQGASAEDRVSTVEILFDKGADVNAKGGIYGNALQAAADSGSDGMVELLLPGRRCQRSGWTLWQRLADRIVPRPGDDCRAVARERGECQFARWALCNRISSCVCRRSRGSCGYACSWRCQSSRLHPKQSDQGAMDHNIILIPLHDHGRPGRYPLPNSHRKRVFWSHPFTFRSLDEFRTYFYEQGLGQGQSEDDTSESPEVECGKPDSRHRRRYSFPESDM